MPVDWTRDPVAFTDPTWSSLVEADPEATIFHTPRFLEMYQEELGTHEKLEVAAVRVQGEVVAMAGFALEGDRLAWLGGFDVTDYMGPVGPPQHRQTAATELMVAVADRDDWRQADLAGLPESGPWLGPLTEGARRAGLSVRAELDDVAPGLDLPDSFDMYLAGLPSKLRHEIRRKGRRLREVYPEAHVVDAGVDTVETALDRFTELHRASAGAKGRFMVPDMELFFRRLADAFVSDGTMRLSFLEAGDERLATAVGFRFRDRFFLYNSAYDHRLAKLSPGMVLVAELIREAIEEGRSRFDLLKGDLGYKYRFGAKPRRVCRLLLDRT